MTNHYFLYNSQVTQENASPMTLSVTEVRIHDKYRGRQLLTLPLTLCIALQKPGWVLSENRSLLGFGPLAVLFTILCYSISCFPGWCVTFPIFHVTTLLILSHSRPAIVKVFYVVLCLIYIFT